MSCDSDEGFGSKNDGKSNDKFRYTHEELVDLFQIFPHPPDELARCSEIISTHGPLMPVSHQPLSDLEKISFFKGINSYQALLEKWGKSQRGRGWGRGRRGRFHNDRRNPGGPVFNGVGPPGRWDANCPSRTRRHHSANESPSGPPPGLPPGPPRWQRGRVWVRGGGRGNHSFGPQRSSNELSVSPPDGRTSPRDSVQQWGLDNDVEEIWEDDWDLELIGGTPDEETHDEEWSRILSHASLYDLRESALGGANSPAAWSECPMPSDASPPRSLCLDPPVLQRLVRQQLQRSPSQNNIDPDLLQEMVENVITQLPISKDAKSPLTPTQAAELTEEKRRLEQELRDRNSLLQEHQDRLRLKEEELEAVRRRQMRAWDNGPPHRRNRPKSLAEIQWEQAAEDGLPVACYRPVSWVERVSGGAGGYPGALPSRATGDCSLSHASSQVSLADKPGQLLRYSSMDVINHQDHQTHWVQRKGRRRRVFRRVDPQTLNGLLTTTP